MTKPESSTQSNPSTVYLDDEIDLRQYVEILIRWWREILLIAFGFALLVGLAILVLRLLPAKYSASAEVAIVRVQSDVTFDAKFTTTADAQTVTTNANARRSALIGLVKSDSIAQKVIEQLGNVLEVDERDANALVDNVTINAFGLGNTYVNDSDLIQIAVEANSPDKAAKIATAWAQIFVKEANSTFGQTPDDLVASMVNMQADARNDYNTKQEAVGKFLTGSRVDELNRQIGLKEQIIKELQAGEQDALRTLLVQVNEERGAVSRSYLQAQAESKTVGFEEQKKGQQKLLSAYIGAQYQAQIDVFQQQYQRKLQLLASYNNATVRLQKTLGSAEVLKTQIEAGADNLDGGTVANLQLLKLQTFTDLLDRSTPATNAAPEAPVTQGGTSGKQQDNNKIVQPVQVDMQMFETPLQLQITTSENMSKSVAIADAKSLIDVINTRLNELNKQIDQLSKEMLDGNNYQHLTTGNVADTALSQSIQMQNELLKSLTSTVSTTAVQSDSIITAGISLPFLNFAELQQVAAQYGDDSSLLPTATAALEAEIRQLKSELEFEQAKLRELSQQRDLAWSTLTTVNSKVTELTVSKAAAGSEVRFAAEAVPPIEPIPGPSLILAIAAGGMAGLMLAILYCFVANSMGETPFLKRFAA